MKNIGIKIGNIVIYDIIHENYYMIEDKITDNIYSNVWRNFNFQIYRSNFKQII